MPIAAGEHLGPFVIRTPLGKGGMGEVYLAFDPRLGREIAVKVLHSGAMANAERRARFVQEAKLASALNHRNIVTIYDIDSAEVDGHLVDFVAMEYVRGKTLDKLIGRKGLRLSEALDYARQIADGLSSAHGAGIIHRDLKPSNIIVNDQGEVKILDFGLAKLIEPEPADVWGATESVRLETATGTIAGTAAYMSPEQAEAQNVDERSDIFSFGAVFYEMISGRRAFNGASKLSTLASVVHSDPAPVGEARDPVPRDVERIIERCLRKDPKRRWQNVADLKIAIEDVAQDREESSLPQKSTAGPWPHYVSAGFDRPGAGGRRVCRRTCSDSSASHLSTPDLPARRRLRSQVRTGRHRALQRSMGGRANGHLLYAAGTKRVAPAGSSQRTDPFRRFFGGNGDSARQSGSRRSGNFSSRAAIGRSAARDAGERQRCRLVARWAKFGRVPHGWRAVSNRISHWHCPL